VMLEAKAVLSEEGLKVNGVDTRILWPFQSAEIHQILAQCKMTMSVENNYTGQLVKLIRMETGFSIQHHLRKFDGEPFEPMQVIKQSRHLLKTKPKESVVASVMSDEGVPPDFSPIEHPAIGAEVSRQH